MALALQSGGWRREYPLARAKGKPRTHALGSRDQAKAIPTSWTISARERDVLEESAATLLRQHPCYQSLLIQLGVDAPYIDKDFAQTGCPQPK